MKKFLLLFLIFISVSFPQKFRFAVWGDSQFQNPEVFEETVRRTELLKPDFVIHVGDMIHGYTYSINIARNQWKRFKKQIEPLSSPFYPTPGNHDITTKEIQPAYLETWGNDKLYYSFDYLNSHFVILNTGLNQDFDTIPAIELEWLKNDLKGAKEQENIFISMHSPLHLNSSSNWKTVHDIFKEYKVKAVFTGHYHFYDYREIDGIKYYCLNSSGNMDVYNDAAGRSHHFLWITVNGSDFNTAVITKDNIYPPDFILPGESGSASKELEKDATVIIGNPSNGLDTIITFQIKNNSDRIKNYTIVPGTKDFRWNFYSPGTYITVNPGDIKNTTFRLTYNPDGSSPVQLPYFEITTDYISKRNFRSEHKFYYRLFNPPVASALYTEQNIELDGLDKEMQWKNISSINELYINRDKIPAEDNTEVKVLYDENFIYVFIKGEEPNPGGLISSAYGDIPLVFGDDDFEIYFDTNRDLKTFYRLMVNPAGTVLCSGPKGLFSFKFDVKTFIGNNFWSAEFRIPLKEIGINKNIKGQEWGFNVRRHRWQSEYIQSDWSKMNTYPPYQPEYFGLLQFK